MTRSLRLRALAVSLTVGGLWASVPPPAEADCRTVYCQRQDLQQDRDREAKLKRKVLEDPTNRDAWHGLLLDLLESKFWRERSIAGFDAGLNWEAPPILEHPELFRNRYEAELTEWLAAFREAVPETGDAPCRQAERIEDPENKVQFLQEASESFTDNPNVFRCLAQALVEAGRRELAIQTLETFRDEHPEMREAHTQLTQLFLNVGETYEPWVRALEVLAKRFPDDFESQRRLFYAYDRQSRVEPREASFEEIWRRFPSLEDHHSLCQTFRYSYTIARADRSREMECHARVLREHESSVEAEETLRSTRRLLLTYHVQHKDWPAVRALIKAASSAQELLSMWSHVVDWLEDDGACTKLRTFYDAKGFDQVFEEAFDDVFAVPRLAGLLLECDRAEAGEELLRAWLPRQLSEALRRNHGFPNLYLEELERRLARNPEDVEALQALLAQTDPESQERLEVLRRLAAAPPDDPKDVEPLLELADALERRDAWEEAAQALTQAAKRKPQDADLSIRAGLAALRSGDLEETHAHARRVLGLAATSARQRAEGGYLLGRIALEQDRPQEATKLLDRYFALRLRYEGCHGLTSCDRPFQLHLVRTGGVQLLEAYLERRDRALRAFHDQVASHGILQGRLAGNMTRLCDESPCPRPTKTEVKEAFRAKDVTLLHLSRELQAVR